MDYNTYVRTMRTMLVEDQQAQDASFEFIVPRMIEYAELRIYRELDLFNTYTDAETVTLTSGSRNATVPAAMVVLDTVNLISPAGTTDPDAGTRVSLQRVSIDFLNMIYTTTTTGVPEKFALVNNTDIRVGPVPNGNFTLELVGTLRPDPLSPDNANTFISDNLPDLLVAASMIFGAGYLQNFGAQSDNPQLAQSWETQYQALKAGVNLEEIRRKSASTQWSPYLPNPTANQPRDH